MEALRAPVGMKDERETTAPPGDGQSLRERKDSLVTATKANHLGSSVVTATKAKHLESWEESRGKVGDFLFPTQILRR